MRYLTHALLALLIAALASCHKDEFFTIEGEVAGAPNMNVYLRYYADDAVRTAVTAATDGKFAIKAESAEGSVIEILDNEMFVLGRLYLVNGDKVKVHLERHDPYRLTVEGSEINEQWAKALNDNADKLATGDPRQINDVVERYIAANSTSPVASLMFATLYDASISPLRADSVLQSIDPEARLAPAVDSYVAVLSPYADAMSYDAVDSLVYRTIESQDPTVFRPTDSRYSVIAVYNEQSRHSDSITPNLKALSRSRHHDLQVIDLCVAVDTNAWKRQIRRDTIDWVQAWIPGGIFARGVDRLALPSLPYYVVLDSAGRQIYRGASFAPIEDLVK